MPPLQDYSNKHLYDGLHPSLIYYGPSGLMNLELNIMNLGKVG
jgi:hypothetical protein